jgi:hypothetical protein
MIDMRERLRHKVLFLLRTGLEGSPQLGGQSVDRICCCNRICRRPYGDCTLLKLLVLTKCTYINQYMSVKGCFQLGNRSTWQL